VDSGFSAQPDIFFNCARRFTELALHPADEDNSKIEEQSSRNEALKIKER
jgi:hypothetical protein